MSPRFLSFARLLGLSALLMGLSVGCDGSSPGANPPPIETPRPDAERSTVEVSRAQGVVADGQDASALTVTVRRAGGEPMGGLQVRLEVSGEGAKVTPADGYTDTSGVLKATLTATKPGAKTVKVSVMAAGGAVVLGTQPTVTFGASAAVATKLAFATTALSATAGAPVAPALEVSLLDAKGSVVAGATNEVTLALGAHPDGAVLEGTVTARAVNGVARFPEVVLKKAGTGYTLVASAAGLAGATSAAFDVVPSEVASLTLQTSAQSVTAGEAVALTVTVGDALGNLATNYVGTVQLTSTDATAVLPVAEYTFTAADAGQHTFQGLVFKRAGTARVTVTEKVLGALLQETADVGVLPGAAAKLAFTAQPASQSVRKALTPVQVTLTDAFDNKVAVNAPAVTVALVGGSGLGGDVTVAPADGVASFTGLSVDAEGAGYTLTASASGLTGATSAAFNIVDDVAPARPELAAGTVTKDSIAVEWNAVGDDGVLGTATAYELRYATSAIVTDADFAAATRATTGAPQAPGTREGALLSGLSASTPYFVALQVTDSAGNTARSDTLQVSTQDVQVAGLVFTQQPVSGIAGTALADIRVSLVDADGNVVTRATSAVTLTLSANAAATVTRSATLGVATFSGLVINLAGTGYTFQASSGGLPTVTSDAFSISPASVAQLSVLQSQSGAATAGVSTDFTVTALDAFDNVVTGYTGTVAFSSSDAKARLPASHEFSAGDEGQKTFSVTFESSGTQQLHLSDAANSLTASVSYAVSAGPAAGFTLTAPSAVSAGATFEARVTALDAYGNVATGYQGTVRLSSTDAAVPAVEHTFAAAEEGVHAFSVALKTAGARELQAQDTVEAALVATHALTVNPSEAAKFVLSGGAGPYDAGTSFSLEVVAQDAFGNVATGYVGNVLFTSSDSEASLPQDAAFIASDNGRRTFTGFVLNTGGPQSIEVADTTNPSVTGTFSVEVIARPTEATSFVLNAPAGPYTAGQTVSVEVVAYTDALEVAEGYTGTVRFTSSDASAVLPADFAFTDAHKGRHFFDVVFKKASTSTLTVTDTVNALLTKSLSVEVQADVPAKLVFTSEPANGTVRAALGAVRVALVDAHGNVTTATAPDVQLALKGGSATLSGTTTVTPVDGVATFSTLSVDQEGTGYQLTATAGAFPALDSATFDIVDNLAPSAPTLAASAATTSITLTWTAVGDDASQGLATAYELRYATSAITNDAEFSAASPIATFAPKAPGSAETYMVAGLAVSTEYHFALKVLDGANNASPLASISATTLSPCDGVTCTPQPASCAADRRGVVTHASACVVSGNSGTCEESTQTLNCSAREVCVIDSCVSVTAAPQVGRVLITEFRAVGGEFIELLNTTGADLDVRGFILENKAWQRATLRAATDPSDAASTPVVVPAGGVLYGVANPAGAVPAGVGFVYGAPGTDFSLDDTGDLLVLSEPSGIVEDVVDFRSFVTSPSTPLTATAFVGFAGSSTQLDPTKVSVLGNDSAANWCVSFYPASGVRSKVTDTAGAANGSCGAVVINEVLVDPASTDDGKAFVELAGPGGALVGGLMLTDVEGRTLPVGALNEDTDFGIGERDAIVVLPAGTRLPADGILLVADGENLANSAVGPTTVPNFVAGVDVVVRDIDLENTNDSVQLISADGMVLLDVLGHETSATNFPSNAATYNVPGITVGLALYENNVALFTPSAVTLARSPASLDTNNNRTDFHGDPSPTPGLPNDNVSVTVSSISPNNGLASTTTTNVIITGNDFFSGVGVKFGAATASCSVTNSTTLTCTAPTNSGTAAVVDVTVTSHASFSVPPTVLPAGFTYTGVLNGAANPAQADYCNLQFPSTLTVATGQQTAPIYGQLYEGGLTDANGGPVPGLKAEVGYGPLNSNPSAVSTWRYFSTAFNTKVGNNFEFQGTFTAPSVTATTRYAYTYRFSFDNGLNWTYCDKDGAGGNSGLSFSATQLGELTVNP